MVFLKGPIIRYNVIWWYLTISVSLNFVIILSSWINGYISLTILFWPLCCQWLIVVTPSHVITQESYSETTRLLIHLDWKLFKLIWTEKASHFLLPPMSSKSPHHLSAVCYIPKHQCLNLFLFFLPPIILAVLFSPACHSHDFFFLFDLASNRPIRQNWRLYLLWDHWVRKRCISLWWVWKLNFQQNINFIYRNGLYLLNTLRKINNIVSS